MPIIINNAILASTVYGDTALLFQIHSLSLVVNTKDTVEEASASYIVDVIQVLIL